MTDRYERIRKALAMEPTPGEWYWTDAYPTQDGRKTWSLIGDGGFGILSCDGDENSPSNAEIAFIAACDPDTIRELLAERDQLAAALEAARDGRDALREALVQIDALDPEGHTAGFSVDALRGLIERMGAIARAALELEEADDAAK